MADGTYADLPMKKILGFQRVMRRIPEDMRQDVLEESGEALVGEAQVTAPIKTGNLSESHYVGDFDDGAQIIGVNTDYAMAVHETHPTKKRWFRKAIAKNFRRVIAKSIKRQLKLRGAE